MFKYFSLISKTDLDLRFYAVKYLKGKKSTRIVEVSVYWGKAFCILEVIVLSGRPKLQQSQCWVYVFFNPGGEAAFFVLMQPICFTHRVDLYGNTATLMLLGGTAQESRG